jgi:hypothetical protein
MSGEVVHTKKYGSIKVETCRDFLSERILVGITLLMTHVIIVGVTTCPATPDCR